MLAGNRALRQPSYVRFCMQLRTTRLDREKESTRIEGAISEIPKVVVRDCPFIVPEPVRLGVRVAGTSYSQHDIRS